MVSYQARELLTRVALTYRHQKDAFSRQEIVKKINEIKYLSAQKKVPKLSLRKEIIHLENKLKSIFDIEKTLAAQNKRESSKVAALKKRIRNLSERLAAAEDKDMQKKLDKLTHLLGECLAKVEIDQDVELANQIKRQLKIPEKKVAPSVSVSSENLLTKIHRFKALQSHLKSLKAGLVNKQGADKAKLNAEISLFEKKLNEYAQKNPEVLQEQKQDLDVKHTFLMGEKVPFAKVEKEAEKELPLPPPPKM